MTGQRSVDAAGHGKVRVHPAGAEAGNDGLAELAQLDRLDGQLRVSGVNADHVADRRIGVEAEQQIRSGQLEDMHGVRLDDLPHVHELAQQLRRPRELGSDDLIAGLSRCQVMADRANAADALGDQRHLEEHAPFAELLEAAEFVDVENGPLHLARIVQVHTHFGVTLDTRHGLDHNLLSHCSPPQCQSRYFPFRSGMRPASSSLST